MTPHISAKKDEIAKVVIMPGDPLRAKWIAENLLKDYKEVNSVRGMLAFTGYFNGKKITVMGHGMGIPSIGIYSYELYKFYDVELIIRVGSAGSYVPEIKVKDVVLVERAYSDSTYADLMNLKVKDKIIDADDEMVNFAMKKSESLNIKIKKVTCNSSDVFYNSSPLSELIEKTKSSVVEMEAFALFCNSIILKKKSLCLLTCSDSLVTHESMSPDERQKGFLKMCNLALEIGVSFNDEY